MNEVIIVNRDKCVGCNACVRNCPAPEANITIQIDNNRFVTTVNPDKCITCGECTRTCTHGARDYIDDTVDFFNRVDKSKMVILATPAIKSVFPTKWKSILDYFRKKGHLIYDVSMGADICTWAHLRAIESRKVGNIITQPCAAVVKYIEMYQPELLKNLVPIHSPISCAAVYIKKYLRRNEDIAVLSPCIAKKTEFSETGLVKYNVTFKKLMEQFARQGVSIPDHSPNEYEYAFDGNQGQVGAIYPRPGGLRDNIWLHNPDINITTSEGVHKVYPELDEYAQMSEFKHPEVFDCLSCEHGCNLGPASGSNQSIFDVMATMREVEKESKARRKRSGLFNKGEDKLFKKFDDELSLEDFTRTYKTYEQSPVPTLAQLDMIFDMMGKHTEAEKNHNCHACGYKSCKEMATAIYRGLNTPENCIVHAKSVLVARHSELSIKHETLSEISETCKEISNKLIEDLGSINEGMSAIGESNIEIDDKVNAVNDLLNNVVDFCKANPNMNESSVEQLISILNITNDAFSKLKLNVTATKGNSIKIDDSIKDISKLVKELNNKLNETE